MSNVNAIIATVSEELKKYDSFGVIDEDMMYRDIVLAVKNFGNDATVDYEDVILIENGRGQLPDNFYRLKEVRLAEPIAYSRQNKKASLHTVLGTKYYNLIHELKTSWNECDDCCKETEMKVFKKQIVEENVGIITCNYNRGRKLTLTKNTIKKYCDKTYNFTPECLEEVSISGNTITANFPKGDVYIKYSGFPLDEDGEFDFEDTPNGNLETFLEYHLKTRIAERLILLGVSGLQNLLQFFEEKRRVAKKLTSNELKIRSLQPKQLINKIAIENRRNYDRYSLKRR